MRLPADPDLFHAMIENSFDIISVLGPDGVIRYESPSVRRILGYAPDDMVGQQAFDYVHPEDIERVTIYFRQVVLGLSDGAGIEFRFRHKENRWVVLEVMGTNMLAHPEINGVVVNSRPLPKRMPEVVNKI